MQVTIVELPLDITCQEMAEAMEKYFPKGDYVIKQEGNVFKMITAEATTTNSPAYSNRTH